MNQQGLLADKKHEGRCSGDYFFFTVCEIHFTGFIEALDYIISREIATVLRIAVESVTLELCDSMASLLAPYS